MTLLDNFYQANTANPNDFQRLIISGEAVGFIRHDIAPLLQDYGIKLYAKQVQGKSQWHWQPVGNCPENTDFLAHIIASMAKDGLLVGWRNEQYPLAINYQTSPHALIERVSVPLFGTTGYGVHINGLVKKNNEIYMWLGKRAANKPTSPNMLDQIAAGGLPYGISIFDNMQKECQEEANIPAILTKNATCTGMINYYQQVKNGMRADAIFCYDLWLPIEFQPQNIDGEVAEFFCLPLQEIINMLRKEHQIKSNAALVIIDCALRHGLISPEEKDYQQFFQWRNPQKTGFYSKI